MSCQVSNSIAEIGPGEGRVDTTGDYLLFP